MLLSLDRRQRARFDEINKNIDGIELVAFCDILPFRIEQASAIAQKQKNITII